MRIACLVLCLALPIGTQAFTLLTYNVKGNGVSNWSTNSLQVQAIGRVVSYLNADVITFNEIPQSKHWEMTNFVRAYLPGYFLATNSTTDGFIRSVIASRYPILRSQSWLGRSSLTNFGFNGVFTRDLFEAEIQFPGAPEPVHVFTTHLKCCSDTTSIQRRGAEGRAISNFFVNVFLPTNGYRPYVLTGDLNEDVERPYPTSQFAVQTMTSSPTGLRLTRPVNPFSGNETTWNSTAPSTRFDYVLPNGLLFSNLVSSDIFRSQLLPNPPAPLLNNDSTTASDHLAVRMVFNYPDPPLVVTAGISNQTLVLSWPTLAGRSYMVRATENFSDWTTVATNLVATESVTKFRVEIAGAGKRFRVERQR